jgi:hypothetical protein
VHGVGEALHRRAVTDVDDLCELDLVAELAADRVEPGPIEVAQEQPSAALGEGGCGGASDAARGTGDDDVLSG